MALDQPLIDRLRMRSALARGDAARARFSGEPGSQQRAIDFDGLADDLDEAIAALRSNDK